jgi:hypothetical protein
VITTLVFIIVSKNLIKMKTTLLSVISLFLFAFTCSGDKKENLESQANEAIDEVVGKSADEFNGKLDQLLTLEMASEISGYAATEAEKEYNQVLKSPVTHSVSYQWKKGRNKQIKNPINGEMMDIPAKDFIQLSWVKNTTLKEFKFNYHTPTAEELANADKAMNDKADEMQQQGKVDASQAEMAKEMASEMAKGLSYDEIKGVGEYAVWNNKHKELIVFYKGIQFQITAELSDDEKINKQKSIETAKLISNKL